MKLGPLGIWERVKRFWLLSRSMSFDEAIDLLKVLGLLEKKGLDPRRIVTLLSKIESLEEIEYYQLAYKRFGQVLKSRHIKPDESSIALENIEAFFNLGILGSPIEKNLYRNWSTFAQEGEDLILLRLLGPSGFYVDVGAHHPFRFSNTALLYDHGWSGICVEPNPEGFKKLREFRPRDVTLNIAVLNQSPDQKTNRTFYIFDEPALSTFDKDYAEEMQRQGFSLKEQVPLPSMRLAEIFSDHVNARKIDLLSVDCEGTDLEVLESNDWSTWTPRVVVAEIVRQREIASPKDSELESFMLGKGYLIFARLYNSVIWVHKTL